MPDHNLTGYYHRRIDLIASGESWLVAKNAVISAIDDVGFHGDTGINGNRLVIEGTVSGDDGAIITIGERTTIIIRPTGTLGGYVDMGGVGSSIQNFGRIYSTYYGIIAELGGIVVSNYGTVVANRCIFADAVEGTMINGKNAVLAAADTAIEIHGDSGEKSRILNQGLIESDKVAISSSSADDTVINTGHITGDITLSYGNDTFDTRRGTFKGQLVGDEGDDTLVTDSSKIRLIEEDLQGQDTVKSTVSYALDNFVERLFLLGKKDVNGAGNAEDNVLNGNVGSNALTGGAGSDTLDGGRGNDILRGGTGNDLFGFATGYGKDEITDFGGGDGIYLANWKAIDNFSQLKNHASRHGDDLWIAAGQDTLVLDHFHKSDLQASDFQF